METEKNTIIDGSNTSIESNKDSMYASAKRIKDRISPNTTAKSSNVLTISTSKLHGMISVRTVPTSVKKYVNEELTTYL